MEKKLRKCFWFLRQLHLNREREIITILNRKLVIGSSNFKRGDIFQIIPPQGDGKV